VNSQARSRMDANCILPPSGRFSMLWPRGSCLRESGRMEVFGKTGGHLYRDARLRPVAAEILVRGAASSSLTFSSSRSVTSRRNREFSSWSSAIRSPPVRVRSDRPASRGNSQRTASHETLQPEFAIVDDLRNLQTLYNHTVPCAGLMAIRALSQPCLWHGNTDEVGCAPSVVLRNL
jgi:hypothetical protein